MKPIDVQVNFFSDTNAKVKIESYTTIKELRTLTMKKLHLNVSKIPYYGIYEICNKKDVIEERFLDENLRVVDILTLWNREARDAEKRNEKTDFKFYLKIFIYYQYTDNDVDSVSMVYYQSLYDYLNGKYNLSEKEVIQLAAFALLSQFGSNSDDSFIALQKKLEKYIPLNRKNLNPGTYWVQKIMEQYSTLKADNKQVAKLSFLDMLKESNIWEGQQFNVKVI
jgi:hypothetical protein